MINKYKKNILFEKKIIKIYIKMYYYFHNYLIFNLLTQFFMIKPYIYIQNIQQK